MRTFNGGGVEVNDGGGHSGSCQLLHQVDGTLQRPAGDVGVAATLVAEGGIGLQAVALAGLADADGVEVGTLQEDACGVGSDAALLAAKNARNAHALLFIAYHKVATVQLALYAVEGDEGGVLRQGAHHHVVAGNHVGIEGVEGLAHFHEHEVGDVDHVVDGTDAHGAELVLQPVRRVGHMDILQGDACVSGAEFRLLDGDADAAFALGG